MDITPGTRLGPYEVGALLGAGGMGAVYRGRDTRLDRSVAIKVLPASASADPRLRERLAREARAISALSHPNICALYDVGSAAGVDYLVMELLDGETLAQRLVRGPLPIAQAVTLAVDIALALDAAHRAGLVHRDLKPGNIMLTRNGARLLDFGLAKPVTTSFDADTPTARAPLTREGAVIGTLRYMAPEQLEGRDADSRTDLFAFGLVLYEMLSGKLISALGPTQPASLRSVNPDVSPELERIVNRCLEKNPDDRWQSARDLAETLRWSRQPGSGPSGEPVRARKRLLVGAIAIAVVLAAMAGAALISRRRDAATPRPVRFSVSPPPGMTFRQHPIELDLAISPDGRTLAFVALEGRRRKLFVRSLDSVQARPLEGTDGAAGVFWSPDSKWLGFFSGGFLKKVLLDGGPAQTLCSAQGMSGSWNAHGQILFTEWGSDSPGTIRMVRDTGGPIVDVTREAMGWAIWPSFLPDERHFVFCLPAVRQPGLYVGSIDRTDNIQLILPGRSRAEVRGDNIFYVRDSVLLRQRFDAERLAVKGDPIMVAEAASYFEPLGASNFSVSHDASVIVWQRTPLATQLVWRERSGRELARVGKPELYRHFALSPDGQRVAADIFDRVSQISNVWLFDLDRGVRTLATSNRRGASAPLWTRKGDALIMTNASAEGSSNAPSLAVLTLSDGSVRSLRQGDGVQYATDITAKDDQVLYTVGRGRYREIEMIPIAPGGRPTSLGDGGAHDESDAVLSPDQRWLAFQSDESGRPEVYIRPFGRKGEKVQVSGDGGTEPQWTADGRSLVYLRPAGMLMQSDIDTRARVNVIRETSLFLVSSAGIMEFDAHGVRHYLVAGDRILVREIPGREDADPVMVLVNARPGSP